MARGEDLEHLALFTRQPWTVYHMPADSGGAMHALHRQLPHLLACAKFVEEHGSAALYALESLARMPSSFSFYAEHANAHAALESLRTRPPATPQDPR